jgi:anti-sigma B factor antagonist
MSQNKTFPFQVASNDPEQNPGCRAGLLSLISVRRQDKTTIFDLSGDIDFANSPKVRGSVLREIRERHTSRVMMNLTQVRYIDSSGVASLVEGLKASRDLGSRFVLFGLSASVREVLQLSGLIKVFEIYNSEEQAITS